MQVPEGTASLLHMQVKSGPDVAGLLDRLMAEALPGRRGLSAWRALLKAHATLMRRLATDLQTKTGLALGDFAVLGRLPEARGPLSIAQASVPALRAHC